MDERWIPMRWASRPALPTDNHGTREMVAGTTPGSLIAHSTVAFEILSYVAGKQLRRAQRRVLFESLEEQLKEQTTGPEGAGPFSQIDVLGAVLGLHHFASELGGDFVFVRIPECGQATPDLWAVRHDGTSWNIELKACAPLSTEVRLGARLDTCRGLVYPQVRKALEQLRHPVWQRPVGTPAISITSAVAIELDANRGRALAVVVLPDAPMRFRRDILPAAVSGCPTVGVAFGRCADHCLSAIAPDHASATSLLWYETATAPATEAAPTPWHQILAACHASGIANWAGSQQAADEAIHRFVDQSLEFSEQVNNGRLTVWPTIFARLLAGTRSTMASKTRTDATRRFLRVHRLEGMLSEDFLLAEASQGLLFETPRTMEPRPPNQNEEIVNFEFVVPGGQAWGLRNYQVNFAGGRWYGTWRRGVIRAVPSLDALGRRLDAEQLWCAANAAAELLIELFIRHYIPGLRDGHHRDSSFASGPASIGRTVVGHTWRFPARDMSIDFEPYARAWAATDGRVQITWTPQPMHRDWRGP